MAEQPVPDDDWATVVRSVPLVSVDLVVEVDGGVVLGKRQNEPAKGEWFVPGGRVHRGERLEAAVYRVACDELGVDVDIVQRLGVYEHFWDIADVESADGKHYVPIGYHVRVADGQELRADDQHAALDVFEPPFEREFHPYVEHYLADAGFVESE